MSVEQNKAIVQRVCDEMNKGNWGITKEFFATDRVYHGPFEGLEGIKVSIPEFMKAFPDLHQTIEDIIAEGDKVTARFTLRCTHKDSFLGIAPTGNRVTVSAILITQLEDGKEIETWDIWDTASFFQQLGIVLPLGK